MYTTKIHNSLFKKVELTFEQPPLRSSSVFFEVRGTNGSGKSTVPFLIQNNDPDTFKASKLHTEYGKLTLTCSPNAHTIVIGTYPLQKIVGGCDTISGADKIEAHLEFAKEFLEQRSDTFDRVFFEGIMTSTSNIRYTRFLIESLGIPQEQIAVAWCNTPFSTCIERIYERNGGKKFNEEMVQDKYDYMLRQRLPFSLLFPNVKMFIYDCVCSKEQMLENWLLQSYQPVVL